MGLICGALAAALWIAGLWVMGYAREGYYRADWPMRVGPALISLGACVSAFRLGVAYGRRKK